MVVLGASALLLVASLAFSQQGNPSIQRPPKTYASVYSELAKAPEKARLRLNPLAQDPGAVAAGQLLFQRHCAECHGDAAEGKKGPSLRADEVQNATPGAIFWILTNGVVRRGMPVWSRLPEPQRWQLVAYIKSLGVKPADPRETSRIGANSAAPVRTVTTK
jgi:mono/diheme cytochrome c family protein